MDNEFKNVIFEKYREEIYKEFRNLFFNRCNFEKERISNSFIRGASKALSIDRPDEEIENLKEILITYLMEGVDKKDYDKIRDTIITKILCIDRDHLEEDEVKEKTKTHLINLFLTIFLSDLEDINEEYEFKKNNNLTGYISDIIQEIVYCEAGEEVFEVEFDYDYSNDDGDMVRITVEYNENSDTENNIYTKFIPISNIDYCKFIFIINGEECDDLKVNNLKRNTIDGKDILEAYIKQVDNQDKSLDPNTLDDLYMKCETIDFLPKYPWEMFIVDSFKFYNQEKYDSSFLYSFIALDSFIEWCIYEFKKLFNGLIVDWIFNNGNEDDLASLLNYLLSNEDSNNTFIKDEVYFYKKISNDKRNLINEKFEDIVNIINFINCNCEGNGLSTKKINLFGSEKNKYLINLKERLMKMADLRNKLAHGNKLDDNENFKKKYLEVLSAFCFIILFWKDEIDLPLLNKNVKDERNN